MIIAITVIVIEAKVLNYHSQSNQRKPAEIIYLHLSLVRTANFGKMNLGRTQAET